MFCSFVCALHRCQHSHDYLAHDGDFVLWSRSSVNQHA